MKPAEKILLLQKATGKTQDELARLLGVSFPTLNSWINGKSQPRRDALSRIDRLLGEFVDELKPIKDPLDGQKRILQAKRKKIANPLKIIRSRKDIYEEFVLALTYHSNRIEGSTLTKKETAAILFHDATFSHRKMVEHLEAKNHQAAFDVLLQHLDRKKPLNQAFLLRLHGILMNGILGDAGEYRRHPVRIVGAPIATANWLKVPDLVSGLLKETPATDDEFDWLARFHAQFEQIHPFADGNGRIGRLWMQGILLQERIAPAVIDEKSREKYLRALQVAQKKLAYFSLTDLICDAILAGYRILEAPESSD